MYTQKSIAGREWPMISLKGRTISVSILLIAITVGLLLFNKPLRNLQKTRQEVKLNIKPAGVVPEQGKNVVLAVKTIIHSLYFKKSTTVYKRVKGFNNKPVYPDQAINAVIRDSVAEDSTPLDEMIVIGMTSQRKNNKPSEENNTLEQNAVADKVTQGQSEGALQKVNSNYKPVSKIIIKGVVVRKDDGLPLTGAIVKANGTNIGVVTDAKGRFTLYVDSNKTELVISDTNYNTLQLDIQKYDSLKTIELEPNSSSLDEAIVTGYTKNAVENKEINAHPNLGWDKLKDYLKENAVSPGGKTGIVKLSFYVHNDGTITAIKIIKGCDKLTDQKAIDLINDGPAWVGNINGQAEKVNLTVDFNK
jgi:hypothetical protein